MALAQDSRTLDSSAGIKSTFKLIATLFKLRIVLLLVFSSFAGAALALIAGGTAFSTPSRWLLLTVCGTLSAAGASAINQYLERNQDGKMGRTSQRPLVNGEIENPHVVYAIALGMIVLAVIAPLMLGLTDLAFWLLLGAAIYVAVYTVWLKPRTSLNIVIGGAAGSCAVIAGGAAMGQAYAPAVWILGALVFTWTPVHFWALALAYRDDYAKAAFPMLPSLVSPRAAAWWIALHTVLTAVLALALGVLPQIDWLMLGMMGVLSVPLLSKTLALINRPEKSAALGLFHTSNLFLAAVFLICILATIWRI